MIYHFDILSSTNDEAFDPRYGEGDIVVAEQQTEGRGQRGHKWLGGRGENLMFTAVFEPRFLPPVRQFLFSEAVALALVDAVDQRQNCSNCKRDLRCRRCQLFAGSR